MQNVKNLCFIWREQLFKWVSDLSKLDHLSIKCSRLDLYGSLKAKSLVKVSQKVHNISSNIYVNTSTGFHHCVLTDSGFNLHLIYRPIEEKRQKRPYRCFSILFSFLQEAFWRCLTPFTNFTDPALIRNMFLSYVKLKFLYSVTSRVSLQQCWACQTSAGNRKPVVSLFIFNSLCSEMLLVTAQTLRGSTHIETGHCRTGWQIYCITCLLLQPLKKALSLCIFTVPHQKEKKKKINAWPCLSLDRTIWPCLWKPFVLRGPWRGKGWRSGGRGPRTSARIGFLHLVVMYNSAQEAEDHLERASHTHTVTEERRRAARKNAGGGEETASNLC